MSKVYLASSWKNAAEVCEVAKILRHYGLEVYDFTDPRCGGYMFSRNDLPDSETLDNISCLQLEQAKRAFAEDKKMIDWADVVLLILPSGRSAHLEAGYAVGRGKKLVIVGDHPPGEFDVMYGFADLVCRWQHFDAVVDFIRNLKLPRRCRVCGCTDDHACPGGCYWVEYDLCSACAEKMEKCGGGGNA